MTDRLEQAEDGHAWVVECNAVVNVGNHEGLLAKVKGVVQVNSSRTGEIFRRRIAEGGWE